MKKRTRFLAFTILIFVFSSCGSVKNLSCTPQKITFDEAKKNQKGFTVNISTDWYVYKDDDCAITYSPRKFTTDSKKEQIKISTFGNIKRDAGKRVKSLEDLVKTTVKTVNRKFSMPKKELRRLEHPKYGEYRILKFHTKILNVNYSHVYAIFFQNGRGYKLYYKGDNNNFNSYTNDFSKIVDSFTITE